VLSGAGLALFAGDFFRIMTDPKFYSASNIVPFLVAASIVRIYSIYCNFGIMLKEQTRHIAEASWLKVIIASVGYVFLIPYLGVYGAALTLLVSNIVEFYWVNRCATRCYDMGLQWAAASAMLLSGALCVMIGMLMPVGGPEWFCIRLVCYGCLVAAIYLMPIWEESDRGLLRAGFKKFAAYIVR
jgi:O-antigen/teichoic acid export membrane protein